jgi:hypothetical protein
MSWLSDRPQIAFDRGSRVVIEIVEVRHEQQRKVSESVGR